VNCTPQRRSEECPGIGEHKSARGAAGRIAGGQQTNHQHYAKPQSSTLGSIWGNLWQAVSKELSAENKEYNRISGRRVMASRAVRCQQDRTPVQRKGALPLKRAAAPSSSSMRSNWLYLAMRSVREAEPVLICPAAVATAKVGDKGVFRFPRNGAK